MITEKTVSTLWNILCVLGICIVVLRIKVVLNLRKNYPDLYESLGHPGILTPGYSFVIRLKKEFSGLMSSKDAMYVRLLWIFDPIGPLLPLLFIICLALALSK